VSGRVAAILPARLGSTRLPKKPLLAETGRCLIQHVYERVKQARRIDRVIVATDAEPIAAAVRAFGGEVRLTDPRHPSGTDRVAEVARELDATHIINVQGDEPEIDPFDLDALVGSLVDGGAKFGTLGIPFRDLDHWKNPNAVKVIVDATGHAIYFSRSAIPHVDPSATAPPPLAWKHIGVYGFERETLLRFAALPPCELERIERLEQLRALYNGLRIRVIEARTEPIGIDTPEDYRRFVARFSNASAAS
jgi:3-deoxy-manno-octulosonate cytidylyltransferase (CMP-KDO synthetase)